MEKYNRPEWVAYLTGINPPMVRGTDGQADASIQKSTFGKSTDTRCRRCNSQDGGDNYRELENLKEVELLRQLGRHSVEIVMSCASGNSDVMCSLVEHLLSCTRWWVGSSLARYVSVFRFCIVVCYCAIYGMRLKQRVVLVSC